MLQFDSEETARAHEARPEQHRWWTEASALLDEVAIRNGTRTDVFLTGDPAHAGFVQVVRGRVSNFNDAREHLRGLQDALKDHLPALLGTVTVEHGAGWFTRGSTTPRRPRRGQASATGHPRFDFVTSRRVGWSSERPRSSMSGNHGCTGRPIPTPTRPGTSPSQGQPALSIRCS